MQAAAGACGIGRDAREVERMRERGSEGLVGPSNGPFLLSPFS